MLAGTRVAFDPAASAPRDALLTFLAVACPVLVGRWVRGQGLLQRELRAKVDREARDRARAARQAAEEERARIAADLQVAVAGGLARIASDADAAQAELGAAATAAPAAPPRVRPPPPGLGWRRSAPRRAPRWPTCGGCSACCATTASRRGSRRPGR